MEESYPSQLKLAEIRTAPILPQDMEFNETDNKTWLLSPRVSYIYKTKPQQ